MIAREGFPFILPAIALTGAAAVWLSPWALLPGLPLCAFLVYFFRDPERPLPAEPGAVSPADGRVVLVRELTGDPEFAWLVSIFMSPLDVHVNRSPLAGRLDRYEYFPGRFRPAWDERCTLENERNQVDIAANEGRIRFSQVAGVLARRIVFRRRIGEVLQRGERVGLIRFGSRVDVWLPAGARILVRPGERVWAASTLLARFE